MVFSGTASDFRGVFHAVGMTFNLVGSVKGNVYTYTYADTSGRVRGTGSITFNGTRFSGSCSDNNRHRGSLSGTKS